MLMSLPVVPEPGFVPVTNFMAYVTEECNLRCSYCFVNKQPRHMTMETARKMIDFCLQPLVSGQEPFLSINFFGGEPLLRAEFLLELLTYIQERGADRFVLGAAPWPEIRCAAWWRRASFICWSAWTGTPPVTSFGRRSRALRPGITSGAICAG